jgi:hypothetical protein
MLCKVCEEVCARHLTLLTFLSGATEEAPSHKVPQNEERCV